MVPLAGRRVATLVLLSMLYGCGAFLAGTTVRSRLVAAAPASAAQMTVTVVVIGPPATATPTAVSVGPAAEQPTATPEPTSGATTILLPAIMDGSTTRPDQIAEDGQVYGLLGRLQAAEDQPFSTYLITADQVVFGLVGSTPAVESQIDRLRDDGGYAKVWGLYTPDANAATVPTVVVSDILAADGPEERVEDIPQGQANPVVTIAFDLVNLRTGPGNRFPPSGQATMSQVCDVVGRNELATWYLIDCLGGESGWIDSRLVGVQGDIDSAPIVSESGEVQATPTSLPVTAATPTPAIQPPPADYWQVTFYNNTVLSEPSVLEAAAGDVNFDWGTAGPNPAVAANLFSARFRRTIDFPTGYYRFLAEADDGIRVYLDGAPLIDEWHGATGNIYSVGRYLTGQHIITIDYYQNGGDARVRFWYEYLGNSPQWQATYYGGVDLLGIPVFEQPEASTSSRPLDYYWGTSSPMPGRLSNDFWSGRWLGRFRFETGNYVFNSVSDDGVRVYLNDTLVIDSWVNGRSSNSVRFVGVGAGEHTVRVEFYEQTGSAELTVWWYREAGSQISP